MPNHPLAEVFGFPTTNLTNIAERYRINKLCPYNNKVPSCTKDKVSAPLGVCSIFDGDHLAITCPVRFRQDWLIVEDAAKFLFEEGTDWTSLQEIRLNDSQGKSAGNIDFVLLAHDKKGKILDFGSLEVQAVYISGNVRRPFENYMSDRKNNKEMIWNSTRVNPDYLSSSRKRLVPQMLYKGSILHRWGKKQTVAMHRRFFDTLPELNEVEEEVADIAWFVYDLDLIEKEDRYKLIKNKVVYTQFQPALKQITTPDAGPMNDFLEKLQIKLDEKIQNNYPPDAPTLLDIVNQ